MAKGGVAKIGLGIVTYNCSDMFRVALESVNKHILDKLDVAVIYNDGTPYGMDVPDKWIKLENSKTKGVAHGKNEILKTLIDQGCTHLFVMEDDMEIISPDVLAIYIAAARISGIPHLNFSQHGPNKTVLTVAQNGPLQYWPNACGAFSYYTRQVIEEFGYLDENFRYAYDHVEHTWRIYKKVYPYGVYPDVIGSTNYIQEQPGALEKSVNRGPDWLKRVNEARAYWQKKDKDCPLRGGTI